VGKEAQKQILSGMKETKECRFSINTSSSLLSLILSDLPNLKSLMRPGKS
jgi:hypothetical protein